MDGGPRRKAGLSTVAVIDRIIRMGEGRQLRRVEKVVTLTNALEDAYVDMTDEELRGLTADFKSRLADGESLDSLMPEAFAAVREASKRTLGLRHFDVQLMGGAALHAGNIAEMKTGEGKTLVATLPAYLNALTGNGVHVVTVNDYLAGYQSELMGRVFRFLGMETGCIISGQDPAARRRQYQADITYGTNNEFGFDHLRDNMAMDPSQLVHRGYHYAIVDEVDSILIDEARTPLIISGPAAGDNLQWYVQFARLVKDLKADEDYEVEESKRAVGILEPGIDKIEKALSIENLYDPANTPLIGFLNNAIKAKELFRRDREYVVQNGEVHIVDEHTGRLLAGRRYSEGLHQAIEAKEGVQIKAENQTYASITLQNYFRQYGKLAGMTGTAQTEAAELNATYGMNVISIPTHKPMIRIDQSDLLFKSEQAKYNAIIEDVLERHKNGQPMLIGTVSVEKSETLSKELRKHGIKHKVLNAKQHDAEAAVVAEAGRKGAVTVATNMAGRGTDIMLGGSPEFRAVQEMHRRGIDPHDQPDEYERVWDEVFAQATTDVATEHEEVLAAGGLYVLGTERHESRRIDNQLRGRSGRQGDPGESRFYLSLEDDLMRMFQSGLAATMMNSGALPDDLPIESKMLTRGVRSAQAQIEGRNAEIRKNILKYDDVASSQRTIIYGERRRILNGENLRDEVRGFVDDVVGSAVRAATLTGAPDDWDLEALWTELRTIYPVSLTVEEVVEEAGGIRYLTQNFLERELTADARVAYDAVEERIGADIMRQVERQVLLQVIDLKWREHLYEMDYLKEGIGLRAMGQRDPLIEYQREAHQMFNAMSDAVKEQSLQVLFRVEKREQAPQPTASVDATTAAATATKSGKGGDAPAASGPKGGEAQPRRQVSRATTTGGGPVTSSMGALTYSGPSDDGSGKATTTKAKAATKSEADGGTFPGTPKNAMCPCGSGKKYKMCHGKNE
ncbi:preprotein translocase subunit SecA [Demequina sp. TTPB684]|uniref:preprotein translocase subunit SecA n=1 Tax=unclassified Demequina TaxID=2620311 RepID=UPI001CF4E416|nr:MULTISPECIES: preprotein translocase subunit SecA [unclassified Demequina]MCB2413581.1 preprotein translocase subunit SecA [Demequina sp. TTPB684]UPU88566.1 preprotein translocase subunit SecA [Demequina sp. TMPB413]